MLAQMMHPGLLMHLRANTGTKCRQVTATLILCATVARADQPDPVTATVSEALALCSAADAVPIPERMAILSRGLQRAEEAVRANPQDAAAHFAVFCTLGKRAELRRQTLGFFGILGDVGRARREIDDTLVLAPNYRAALAAKGQMLMELPRVLGGDPEEGERLLRRALTLDPSDRRSRFMLANSLETAGEHEAASSERSVARSLVDGLR